MKKENKVLYWLAAPAVAFLFVLAKVYPVLPAVMQDEYVYSIMSRFTPFAAQEYPNYLFSFVFSSTNVCGDGFYSCAKNLNIVFFLAMLVFVYLIAARLLNRGAAIVIVTLTILSPLHVYISYFMPEAMYFAFMAATVWFTLHAVEKGQLKWWASAGVMLGLTALVKPHALFAVPVIVIYAFVISYKNGDSKIGAALGNAAFNLVGFALVKFGLGFAFAGVAGLTWFGSSYGSSIDTFINRAAAQVSQATANAGLVVAGDQTGGGWQTLFSVGALQLALHLGLLLLLWGVPALLSISVIKGIFAKKEHVSALGAFVSLTGALAISFAIVVAVFEGFVTSLGDDHSARIITRYYDFLIPLLLILAFAIERYVEPKVPARLLQFGIMLASLIFVVAYFPNTIDIKFSDSVTMMGLLYYPAVIIVLVVIALAALFYWVAKPDRGAKLVGWFAIPLMVVVLGFASQGSLLQKVGTTKAYFDVAGQAVKPYLDGIEGSKIGVVGQVRPEVFTAKFWIDKPGIQDRIIGEGKNLSLDVLNGIDYALILGASEVEGAGEVITNGEQYVLVKVQH